MPRRARRDDVQSAAMEDAAHLVPSSDIAAFADSTQSASLDSGISATDNPQAEAPEAAATKARRRRSPKTAKISEGEAVSGEQQDVSGDSPIEAKNAQRRQSNRKPKPAVAEARSEAAQASAATSNSSRRRQVGGRRTATEAAAAITAAPKTTDAVRPVTSQDESESSDHDAGTRSKRTRRSSNRRRRQAGNPAAAPDVSGETIQDDVIDEAPLDASETVKEMAAAPSDETSSEESGDDSRRSRRSRRGGRRRKSGSEDTAESAPTGAAEAAPDDADSLTIPAPRQHDFWRAPFLVPSIAELGVTPVDLGIDAVLDAHTPTFIINGKRIAPHLFFASSDGDDQSGASRDAVHRQIQRAAAAGIHLHTCVIYLPLKNAYGERSFAAMDAGLQSILDADPDGFVVLRIQCVATNFWARTHADQMVRYKDGSDGDVSIASEEFWSDCVETLAAVAAHLGEPGGRTYGRVFAIHLDKGEWFYEPGAGYDYSAPNLAGYRAWLHQKYQSPYAIKSAWHDGTATFETAEIPSWESHKEKQDASVLHDRKSERRIVDYGLYASDVVGRVLCGLATAVKEITQGKILVFVPYGYSFEFATRNDSGHQAPGQVLDCPNIDVLTGPNSYVSRAPGGVGGFASPVDSILLHDKLWVVEDDTKTYLALDDTPDTYNPKINGQQETVMVHRRNYFAALTHGCGVTWMDLWGQGWLDSDSLWNEIGQLIQASQRIHDVDGPIAVAPETAILLDEASYAWVHGDAGGHQLQTGLIIKARDLLLRSGASVGFFLQSDVDKLPSSVKVVFFLNALQVTTTQRQAIRDKVQRNGVTLVWLYAPGMFDENGVAVAEVSEIVGMSLKAQPWNSRVGTIFTEERHPVTERLSGGKRMGTEEVLNPSFTVNDPQSVVLGEYAQSGDPSIVAKTHEGGWRSVFVGEPHLTGELIRGIFRFSNVHLYDVQDDVVYARGDGLLLIHAPYSGQRMIHFPRSAACYNLFENRLVTQNSSSVRLFMRGRSTHLLIWGDLESIVKRTGRSTDDLLESLNTRSERELRDSGGSSRRNNSADDNHDESDEHAVMQPDSAQSLDQSLEHVLKAVVQEIYVNEDEAVGDEGTEVQNSLRDAVREASRITDELLSDLVTEFGDAPESDAVEGTVGDAESAEAQTTEQKPSSRRRRWRRRRPDSDAPKPDNPNPVSVDDFLGDLAARRNRPPNSGQDSEV